MIYFNIWFWSLSELCCQHLEPQQQNPNEIYLQNSTIAIIFGALETFFVLDVKELWRNGRWRHFLLPVDLLI